MSACGAVVGGVSLDNVDVSTQSVIQGVVSKDNSLVSVGYVRLLDKSDEFVAEVPVSMQGEFRFFAAPGDWTVVTLIPGATNRTSVTAALGKIVDLEIVVT
jgi:hypothetical protein